MREQDLNTMMSVVSDPINNVYKIATRQDKEEVQRMVRIFAIAKAQQAETKSLSVRAMNAFQIVLSNN